MLAQRLRAFRQTLHDLGRSREIVSVFLKYGYEDLAHRLHLPRLLGLPTRRLREEARSVRGMSQPEKLRHALEELGPTFVKAGQIVSSRSGLMPPEFTAELVRLQDEVAPVPFAVMESVLNEELKCHWSSVFTELDQEPIGAASIAQVHRAVLRSGASVVVKVQRPGIVATLNTDTHILRRLAGLLEAQVQETRVWQPVALIEQLKRDLAQETDFTVEAGHMQRFAAQFAKEPGLRVPQVIAALGTPRLLVMEFVRGQKLAAFLEDESSRPLRHGLAHRLGDLMLKQIFVHGFFHADPHPGNLFILPGPDLCFIDFGRMGFLSREQREGFARLVVAIADRDEEVATRALVDLSESGSARDSVRLETDMADFIHRNFNIPMAQFSFNRVAKELLRLTSRHHLLIPPDLVAMLNAFGQMEETVRSLNPEHDLMTQAKPFLRDLRLQQFGPKRLLRGLTSAGDEVGSLLKTLPRDVKALVGKLKDGEARITMLHDGLEPLRLSLDQVTNRIAFAIVLAALIMGNGLIIHARVPPLWHGVPIVGLVGFFLTAVLGLWLLISILRHGRM
ncbi:MAG TPA: ABC transporter [Verrucomicrobiales bacterium]|nr:ABC transporter [Verrucomicrobiales bacterium]